MPVSSKWFVTRIEGQSVFMQPVCRGVENREWSSATPGGEMRMWISNPNAMEQFKQGEEYEAVFTHAPKPAPGDRHPVEVVEQTAYGKSEWLCGRCGSYAFLNEDGTPNWDTHRERFGE